MADRARDRPAQAEKELEHAEASARDGRQNSACFAAQQAAEKTVTGLHLRLGQEAWGHVVARLLQELPRDVPASLVGRGKVLDNLYVPSRCPNGHPEGAPIEHCGPLQSGEAIRQARESLAFVRSQMA